MLTEAWFPFSAADTFIANFLNALPALIIAIIFAGFCYKFFKGLITHA